MSKFKDDTFLARWLNNELNDEELKNFKSSKDYELFMKIREGSGLIDEADFDKEQLLMKIKSQRNLTLGNNRKSKRLWIYSAAASLLLLVSFFAYNTFFSSSLTTYQTQIGQMKNIQLPDGSEVVLNANSSLSFLEDGWNSNRELTLKGEAYFVVEKGDQFVVHTTSGDVEVLGTQFTVKELEGFFEVKCFEGSVKVSSGNEEEVLKPKNSVRRIMGSRFDRRDLALNKPAWLDNQSSFDRVPIRYVFQELNNQYGVKFQGADLVEDKTYSGSFPHNNLDLALKVVLDPLNVNYEKKENVVVLSAN